MTEHQKNHGGSLGTFAGVFTPSVLTILGIILFLRMGYVVGAAGIGRALLIVLVANTISVLTSISLATVATNLRVKGGGDYYLISRTLGVEFGGALGIVLFLAQSVSIAFYAIGFGEGVANMLTEPPAWAPQAIAGVAVALLFVLAWFGADVATKFQYVVMAILFTSIAFFFVGGFRGWNAEQFGENMSASSDASFWMIFAIFFPAVTGFTQGVSMSGDLKDPARSLPVGTFLAVGLSAVVYLAVAVVFAGTISGGELVSDFGAMRRVSVVPWLVDAGVISATLSSALASFLGGPRILQSLASDRVFPWLNSFAVGHGDSQNPRRGVLLAAVIAAGTIAIGKLELIAPIVSMFFLVSYGLLNYATYFEANTNSPSFRPTFRYFHPYLSLLGGLACLGAMLAINPMAGLLAVAVLFGIYQYLKRNVEIARWSDSSRSHLFQVVRENLHKLSSHIEHPSDWRPILLAFSGDPNRRVRLVRFASWIEGRAGLATVVSVTEHVGAIGRKRSAELQESISSELSQHQFNAFALAVAGPDRGESIALLLQSFGIGPIRANTVLLNWFDHHPDADAAPGLPHYNQYLRTANRFGCNQVILSTSEKKMNAFEATEPDKRRIDVWYLDEANGQLMLLLAHLMTRSADWGDAKLRVLVPADETLETPRTEEDVAAMLAEFRINATPVIVDRLDVGIVHKHSRDATIVFFPFDLRGDEPVSLLEESLEVVLKRLPLTALVHAAQEIDLDAEPEEGPHQEIAEAVDTASAAQDKAKQADRELEQAQTAAGKSAEQLAEAIESKVDPVTVEKLRTELAAAEQAVEDLQRRAAKVRLKADDAVRDAEAITGQDTNRGNTSE